MGVLFKKDCKCQYCKKEFDTFVELHKHRKSHENVSNSSFQEQTIKPEMESDDDDDLMETIHPTKIPSPIKDYSKDISDPPILKPTKSINSAPPSKKSKSSSAIKATPPAIPMNNQETQQTI